jgi:hypothetical protein
MDAQFPKGAAALMVSGALACTLAFGCGTSTEDPAEEIVLDPHAHVATIAQADSVNVEPGRLVFPADGNEALLDYAPGDAFVGTHRSAGRTNANEEGFLRKILGVRRDGATIVLDTEPGELTSVIARGRFETVMGLDDASSSGALAPKAVDKVFGKDLQVGPNDFFIFRTSREIQVPLKGGGTWNFTGQAQLDVKQAMLKLSPRVTIGGDIEHNAVKEFHALVDTKLTGQIGLKGSMQVASGATFIDDKGREGLAKRLTEAIARANIGGEVPDIPLAPPVKLPPVTTFVGPVPVVTTFQVSFPLKCKWQIFGRFEATTVARVDTSLHMGMRYSSAAGWTPEFDPTFDWGLEHTFQVGGGFQVQCSLKPKLALLFYGVAGPAFAAGPNYTATARYDEKCDDPGREEPHAFLEASVRLGFQAEASADINFLSKKVGSVTWTYMNIDPIEYGGVKAERVLPIDYGYGSSWGYCPTDIPIGACTQTETFQNDFPPFVSCRESFASSRDEVDRWKPILRAQCTAPAGTNAVWIDEGRCAVTPLQGGYCRYPLADGKWDRDAFYAWAPDPKKLTVDKDSCIEKGNTWAPF